VGILKKEQGGGQNETRFCIGLAGVKRSATPYLSISNKIKKQ